MEKNFENIRRYRGNPKKPIKLYSFWTVVKWIISSLCFFTAGLLFGSIHPISEAITESDSVFLIIVFFLAVGMIFS